MNNSDKVLEMSDGIENLSGLNPHITFCLVLAWVIVFLALLKGVQSLGSDFNNPYFHNPFLNIFNPRKNLLFHGYFPLFHTHNSGN